MEGIFYRPKEDYKEVLNPLKFYHEQATELIKNTLNCSYEEASEKAKKLINDRFKDRNIKFFRRGANGDREVCNTGLLNFINDNVRSQNIIAPTFTTYLNSKVKPSMLADYTKDNVKNRSIAKKAGQAAKAAGNALEAAALNDRQNNMKIKNNALSGLFIMNTSVITNKTAHSTLTSMTRSITSLSNSVNERLVEGNRALYTPVDAFRAVINESTYCDQVLIKEAVETFNLYLPTWEDVLKVLKRSTDIYTLDTRYYNEYIIPYLKTLNPYQLAGIAYTLDMYHIRIFNEDFTRQFFIEFTRKITGYDESMENPYILAEMDQTLVYYVHSIFTSDIRGMGKDYGKMNEAGHANNIYHTCLNAMAVLEKYKVFFNAFFMVNISPINSFRLENMRRRPVVLSDTDSSAFSTDDLVKWMFGKFIINDESIAVSEAITYITSETIVHQLSRLSRTMNIETENLRGLAMKNEYLWTAHVPSFASKHYYADTAAQEGNIFAESEIEVKGVHLKNSALPPDLISKGDNIMLKILEGVKLNKGLSLEEIIQDTIDIEQTIIDSIRRNETTYLRSSNINEPSAYSQPPESSPYSRHVMWQEVFAGKYGGVGEPPYGVVQVPMALNNKTDIKNWADSIKDPGIKVRLEDWLTRNNKTSLPNIYFNADYIADKGFPEEIIDFIDLKQLVLTLTTQARVILETLGIVLTPELMIKEQYVLE